MVKGVKVGQMDKSEKNEAGSRVI